MIKKILIGLGALALVVAAGAAWAHGPGRHLMMKQMIDKRVAEAEDLIQATPDQRAQIEASKNAIVTALQQNAQARRQQHQDLVAPRADAGPRGQRDHSAARDGKQHADEGSVDQVGSEG